MSFSNWKHKNEESVIVNRIGNNIINSISMNFLSRIIFARVYFCILKSYLYTNSMFEKCVGGKKLMWLLIY